LNILDSQKLIGKCWANSIAEMDTMMAGILYDVLLSWKLRKENKNSIANPIQNNKNANRKVSVFSLYFVL
jgi:hypothetical protein